MVDSIQAAQNGSRVIVVDDNRLIRELARDALEELVDVEMCSSGAEALEALNRQPAALVISDLEMPGINGIQLLEQIRREHPGTEFVVLTANASVETAVSAMRMGAADYLLKPVRAEELRQVVDRVISQRKLIAENDRLRGMLDIVESCRALTRCLDSGEVYAVALDLCLHSVERSRGLSLFRRTAVPSSDGVVFRGFQEGQSQQLREDLVTKKSFDLETVGSLGIVPNGPMVEVLTKLGVHDGCVLAVPLSGGGDEAGVLWILEDDPAKPITQEEIERISIIAGHADIALHNAERYSHAKERAFIDDVTEVYNARYLQQALEHEIQRAERYGTELSVLFLDLDRFKLVNDQHGHLVGSQVLRRLSEVLGECIRQVDTLARYGGDEFVVLLTRTDMAGAGRVAEAIRAGIEGVGRRLGHPAGFVTASIGLAEFDPGDPDTGDLLATADRALYFAKSKGRNVVADNPADQTNTETVNIEAGQT